MNSRIFWEYWWDSQKFGAFNPNVRDFNWKLFLCLNIFLEIDSQGYAVYPSQILLLKTFQNIDKLTEIDALAPLVHFRAFKLFFLDRIIIGLLVLGLYVKCIVSFAGKGA